MLQLIIKDGTAIDLMEMSPDAKHFVVSCPNVKAFQKIWNKLTVSNLSEVQISDDGSIVHRIAGLSINGTQTVMQPDGIIGHFYMSGGRFIEPEPELEPETATEPEPAAEWKQPRNSSPYMTGDRVTFKGKTYVSVIDNNIWSPDARPQGWKEV